MRRLLLAVCLLWSASACDDSPCGRRTAEVAALEQRAVAAGQAATAALEERRERDLADAVFDFRFADLALNASLDAVYEQQRGRQHRLEREADVLRAGAPDCF